MDNKKQNTTNEDINVELGGMGLYGTTSNMPIAGYEATGDIENAGQLENFKKEQGHEGAVASLKGSHQRG